MKLNLKNWSVILLLGCLPLSAAEKTKSKVKAVPDLDRVWTFSFEELNMLDENEKSEYAQSLVQAVSKNKVLGQFKEATSEKDFKTILVSEEKWTTFEKKMNQQCQDKKNYSDCDKVARLRVDLLNKYSTRK